MKKLFLVCLLLITLCSFCCTPVFAAECGGVETNIIECSSSGAGAIRSILKLVVDIISMGVGILAVIGIMVLGIQYLTAGDNKDRVAKVKRRFADVVIGLVIYIIAYAGVSWLLPGGANPGDSIALEGLTVSSAQQTIEVGRQTNIGVNIYPLDAENSALTFTSSNENIATVDNAGNVTTKNPGFTTITATAPDGQTAEVKVSVVAPVFKEKPSRKGSGSNNANSSSSGSTGKASGKCDYNSASAEGCILFCQGAPESWASKPYGNCGSATYSSSGCAPASLAMIIANLTNDSSVTPLVIGNKAVSLGARVCGSGTNASKLIPVVKDYGLNYEKIAFSESAINKALDEGKLVWLSCDGRLPCATTGNGHFIVIRGKTSSGDWTFFNSAYGCSDGYASSKRTYSPKETISAAYNSQNSGPYAIWK